MVSTLVKLDLREFSPVPPSSAQARMSYLALIENHPCPQSRSPWNHSLGFPANKTKNIIMLDKTKYSHE